MKRIIVEAKNEGERIDKFLAREFFLYSRVEIIKRIKKGDVLINNKQIKPSYKLEENDAIMLENFSKEEDSQELVGNKELLLDVIFENKDMIVINKQAGLQVHPSFHEKKNTLVNTLLAYYPEIITVHDGSIGSELRPGIVHRLDKDTSGVMVIARNKNAFNALKENFKNREVRKQYLAIAKGAFKEKEGIIEKSIAKSASYKKQIIARSNTKTVIRKAETHFKVLENFMKYSLLELSPKTGRTHQIRIHLASIGHPIMGDKIYGKTQDDNISVSRQLLHAQKLEFELFGEQYTFQVSAPTDFEAFLDGLRVC